MPFQMRPELSDVSPVAHGSAPAAELRPTGGQGPPVIDFSVSTNPLGPPPSVLAAVAGLSQRDVWRYPDPTASALREAIAAPLGTDPDAVVAGNGSAELIWTLALAAVRPRPEEVLILGPTFGEYERASRLLGAGVDVVRAGPQNEFLLDVPHVAGRIRQRRPRVVWLCNPNNPTGRYLPPPDVQALLEAATDAGALLVIDEAYAPFVDGATSPLPLLSGGHLVLLRSLTKDYALAGLRLGYAVTTPGLAASLRLAQPPWSVSAPAQLAGLAALAEPGHLDRARRGAARGPCPPRRRPARAGPPRHPRRGELRPGGGGRRRHLPRRPPGPGVHRARLHLLRAPPPRPDRRAHPSRVRAPSERHRRGQRAAPQEGA